MLKLAPSLTALPIDILFYHDLVTIGLHNVRKIGHN